MTTEYKKIRSAAAWRRRMGVDDPKAQRERPPCRRTSSSRGGESIDRLLAPAAPLSWPRCLPAAQNALPASVFPRRLRIRQILGPAILFFLTKIVVLLAELAA